MPSDIGNVIRFEGKDGCNLTFQTIDDGVLTIITLFVKKKKDAVGRAILLSIPTRQEKPLILDLCIYNEADRKKGYGSYLLTLIKEISDEVHSGAMTRAGHSLLMHNGFKYLPDFSKKGNDLYIWNRRNNDERTSTPVRESENNEVRNEET